MRSFQLRYDRVSRVFLGVLGMGPKLAQVSVSADTLDVRVGPGAMWFNAGVPTSAIAGVEPVTRRLFSRGVHGWAGRWLVNGSTKGLVRVALAAPVKARTVGVPIKLRELTMSLDEPEQFVAALERG